MSIEPNKKLLSEDGVVTATYAGREWPIPKLAPMQLVAVVPLLPAIFDGFRSGTGFYTASLLSDIATVCFHGLQRGHEDLTREEFDRMGTDLQEMSDFAMAVAGQTNGVRRARPGEKPDPLANGVATPAPPIGAP